MNTTNPCWWSVPRRSPTCREVARVTPEWSRRWKVGRSRRARIVRVDPRDPRVLKGEAPALPRPSQRLGGRVTTTFEAVGGDASPSSNADDHVGRSLYAESSRSRHRNQSPRSTTVRRGFKSADRLTIIGFAESETIVHIGEDQSVDAGVDLRAGQYAHRRRRSR